MNLHDGVAAVYLALTAFGAEHAAAARLTDISFAKLVGHLAVLHVFCLGWVREWFPWLDAVWFESSGALVRLSTPLKTPSLQGLSSSKGFYHQRPELLGRFCEPRLTGRGLNWSGEDRVQS